jgi:hypothetical protein
MNEQHNNFDETFRDRFGDFQQDPPELVWQNVQAGIAGKLGGKKDKRRWGGLLFLSSLSLMMLLSGLYLGLRKSGDPDPAQISSWKPSPADRAVVGIEDVNTFTKEASTNPIFNHQPSTKNDQTNSNPINAQYEQNLTPGTNNNEASGTMIRTDESSNLEPHNDIEPVGIIMNEQQGSSELLPPIPITENTNPIIVQEENPIIASDPEIPNTDPIISGAVVDTSTITAGTEEQTPEHDYGRAANIFLGAKFTPGVLYGVGDSKNAFTYGAQVDVGYQRRNLSIQSGLGIEFHRFDNAYRTEYLAYEATGEYAYVTSFIIDTIPFYFNDSLMGYIYRPIFSTTAVEVYDSVAHQEVLNRQTHYTYLNIPLSVGYHYTHKNWTFGLKAGGNMTILMQQREEELALINENASLSSLSRLTPERKNVWFSFILLPEIEYYFNDDISLYVEPWFRYSFRQTGAESEGYGIKPYSLGLNAGLKIHF